MYQKEESGAEKGFEGMMTDILNISMKDIFADMRFKKLKNRKVHISICHTQIAESNDSMQVLKAVKKNDIGL